MQWLDDHVAKLTPRECEVFIRMAGGPKSTDLAAELSVEETTIRAHLRNMRRKFGGVSRGEIVALSQLWNEQDCRKRQVILSQTTSDPEI